MSKYLKFMNTENGVRQIFTREKIMGMSGEEFQEHESDIFKQLNDIGIPTSKELAKNSQDKIFVWCTAKDGKVCPECISMEGKTFENLEDIPDDMHPNCRCYIKEIDLSTV